MKLMKLFSSLILLSITTVVSAASVSENDILGFWLSESDKFQSPLYHFRTAKMTFWDFGCPKVVKG